MPETTELDPGKQSGVLLQIDTGIKGPLYADGHVVHASDLTLDRDSHSQALWRMRRLLHGWGIVAGFQARVVDSIVGDELGGTLQIRRGYGIAPDGEELYLPRSVVIKNVAQRMLACCGPDSPGCDLDDHADATDDDGDSDDTRLLNAWVIARSIWVPAAQRPGLPQNCDHPGNTQSPTRTCNRVSIELRCEPPDGHLPDTLNCQRLQAMICERRPLPFALSEAEGGILVLGRLVIRRRRLFLDRSVRQPLLPTRVIQDYLACQCDADEPPDDDDNLPPIGPIPIDPPPIEPPPIDPPPIGPLPIGPVPIGPPPIGPNPIGPDPIGPPPIGPNPIGPDPVGPLPIGPNPIGPNPIGPGPIVTPTPVAPVFDADTPVINPGPPVRLDRFLRTHDAATRLDDRALAVLRRPGLMDTVAAEGLTVTDVIMGDAAGLLNRLGVSAEDVDALKIGIGELDALGPRFRF